MARFRFKKGHHSQSEFKKGCIPWNKGIPRSEETKRKIRDTKSRQNIVSWNKGLTKETDERLRKISEAMRGQESHRYGKPAWSRGLTKETDERVNKGAETLRKTLSREEVRTRKSLAIKGKQAGSKHPHWGKRGPQTSQWKGGISIWTVKVRTSFKYRLWRSDIFTRDDFTCQECGRRGGALRAHHTPKSFAFILELNDIRTFEQAMDCDELWSINNGITYCTKCHGIKEKELRELKSVFRRFVKHNCGCV